MEIGIIGGTGAFGRGLALRWGQNHTIIIGSRNRDHAETSADEYKATLMEQGCRAEITGCDNTRAAEKSELVVLCITFEHLAPIIAECRKYLSGKVVISPVTALVKKEVFEPRSLESGSAAMWIQECLQQSKIVAALHTIPAHRLRKLNKEIPGHVPVSSDHIEAKKMVMNLVGEIKNLRPLDAGPLKTAALTEAIVPLLLNLKVFSNLKSTSIRFV